MAKYRVDKGLYHEKSRVQRKQSGPDKKQEPKGHPRHPNPTTDYIFSLQRTIGNKGVEQLIKSGAFEPLMDAGKVSALEAESALASLVAAKNPHVFNELYDKGLYPHLQAKLEMGSPNEVYEQEADRVAEKVVNMTDADVQRQSSDLTIQAKGNTGGSSIVDTGVESGIRSMKGNGQPLPESLNRYYKARFNHEFDTVRIHTGEKADSLARAINARAFTTGNDIFFAQGEYSPGTRTGKMLLAHELTHIVQQQGGKGSVSTKKYVFRKKRENSSRNSQKFIDPFYRDIVRFRKVCERAAKLVDSGAISPEENERLKMFALTLTASLISFIASFIEISNELTPQKIKRMKSILRKYHINTHTKKAQPFLPIIFLNLSKIGGMATKTTQKPPAKFPGGQVLMILFAAYYADELIDDCKRDINEVVPISNKYEKLKNEWNEIKLVGNYTGDQLKAIESNIKKRNRDKGPYPILFPKELPVRPYSNNRPLIYINKVLIRTIVKDEPDIVNNRSKKLTGYRKKFNIPNGYAAHHVIPLFLGGPLIAEYEKEENIARCKEEDHILGHQRLRRQQQLRIFYDISHNLYSHKKGVSYFIAGFK